MTAPITAQCGIVRIDLHETSPGHWDVRSAGETVGTARADGTGVTVTVDNVTVTDVSVGRAAVQAVVRLNDSYRDWCGERPVRYSDAGLPSGDAA